MSHLRTRARLSIRLVPTLAGILGSAAVGAAPPSAKTPPTILYGAAYYDEYTPVDRVEEDARLMQAAGITVVRIAESTWGTLEPQPGVFDFSHVDRMLAAMNRHGIKVIVGTPTYAVPTWLAKSHPNVLAITPQGPGQYGPRQNMDITDPDYLAAARQVIIALVDHVRNNPAVIGYQLDNETKPNNTSGPNVQTAFVESMKRRWPSLDAMNQAYGLNYWSNRINSWDDFPSVNASINISLNNAFAEFQRGLVTNFLSWQAGLVRAHARPDQFLTHNFDLNWRGYSFGIQPDVNQWQAARPLDVAGMDIYHPSQDKLTGAEIAFGGDLARSLRNGQDYLVIETQAQGFPQWTPYPGQLRLQAFSHLASGAQMIEYWHWATTPNAVETYWRGILGQDYKPNAVYAEAATIGADLKRLGPTLAGMKKDNKVAIYVSNTALTAFESFKIGDTWTNGPKFSYNDVVRGFYDALYRRNIEVDLISPDSTEKLDGYKMVVVPALYAASDAEISRLNDYAKRGGHLVYTFKGGFADENDKVRYATQPGGIAQAAGVEYQEFAYPENVTLAGDPFEVGEQDNKVRWWMEFLKPSTASVVAAYAHASWPKYAAVTRNQWGKGEVMYIGFMPTDVMAERILLDEAKRAGVEPTMPGLVFPLIAKEGILTNGRRVRYVFNYSPSAKSVTSNLKGTDLLSGREIALGQELQLAPWGMAVIESTGGM